ncbi:MAG: hypothetical protein K0Q74_1393, partial [Gammaproteobacteria bacterium]|nr:hypothetical protein [Gammaproteobacteria bacterium]
MEHSSKFQTLVAAAKQRVPQTNVGEVQKMMAAGEPFHFVDVREESEWRNGCLPKAIHLGKGVIERDIVQAIPDTDAKIVLYCGGGSRSTLAAENLIKMGYKNVWSMEGGFRGW